MLAIGAGAEEPLVPTRPTPGTATAADPCEGQGSWVCPGTEKLVDTEVIDALGAGRSHCTRAKTMKAPSATTSRGKSRAPGLRPAPRLGRLTATRLRPCRRRLRLRPRLCRVPGPASPLTIGPPPRDRRFRPGGARTKSCGVVAWTATLEDVRTRTSASARASRRSSCRHRSTSRMLGATKRRSGESHDAHFATC